LSSATKPITAALVMQLVEDGLVGLNRPVQDYLPEICAEGAAQILVHHLLTHTSGFAFHTDEIMERHVLEKLSKGFEFPPCPENQHPMVHQLNQLLFDAPLVCQPGAEMIYSNINYEFLGELIRRVSGRSLEALARERIFDPLGMNDTWYVVPPTEEKRVMQRQREHALAFAPHFPDGSNSREFQEFPAAGAGIFSTPSDVAAFAQCILNGGRYGDTRILSPPTVAAMTRNQIPGIPARLLEFRAREGSWGYGWTIESPAKWEGYNGSLWPLGTLSHSGFGGAVWWVDAGHDIVAGYFEAAPVTADMGMTWMADLFQNAITAAVSD
jgi:CubicO group peptidase (beta-lactamase class C family)